ncbi:IS3 family transposase [Actinocorallia libanotica]|uniref:HTH-like domain-containing protein n=1 Tax=Actinocorallia libanotica TaxID=46162 RepID=A0ABN1S0V1_9ACTN
MVDHLRGGFGVEPVCKVLDLCPSTYYGRKRRPPSARARKDAFLIEQIRDVHETNYGVYGARRVHKQLQRQGARVAQRTVERLMREQGLEGVRRGPSGVPSSLTRVRRGRRTWSTGTSPLGGPISCGWPTSPTCAPGRAGCMWRSCWTPGGFNRSSQHPDYWGVAWGDQRGG